MGLMGEVGKSVNQVRQQAIDETRNDRGREGFAIALAIIYLADTIRTKKL